MKWTRSELLKQSGQVRYDEDIEFDASAFEGFPRLISTSDVHVDGRGYLDDDHDRFYCSIHVTGYMTVPDSITNEPIEIPFESDSNEVFAFGEPNEDEEDARIVTDEVIDLLPAVIEDILLEVPLEVTELEEDEYPEGDGWKVYTEASYQESRKDRIDPRLAKLKQFKSE